MARVVDQAPFVAAARAAGRDEGIAGRMMKVSQPRGLNSRLPARAITIAVRVCCVSRTRNLAAIP